MNRWQYWTNFTIRSRKAIIQISEKIPFPPRILVPAFLIILVALALRLKNLRKSNLNIQGLSKSKQENSGVFASYSGFK